MSSKFTPGSWWIAPPFGKGDTIFAMPQEDGRRNKTVAMGIQNKADARLIVSAPEMYDLLKKWVNVPQPILWNTQDRAKKLLARIDGEEASDEEPEV